MLNCFLKLHHGCSWDSDTLFPGLVPSHNFRHPLRTMECISCKKTLAGVYFECFDLVAFLLPPPPLPHPSGMLATLWFMAVLFHEFPPLPPKCAVTLASAPEPDLNRCISLLKQASVSTWFRYLGSHSVKAVISDQWYLLQKLNSATFNFFKF